MAKPAGGGKTILVIDDDPMAVDIYRAILAPAGYEVLSALSGAAGLELFHRSAVHCVIVDIYMPGMSGLDILEAIDTDPKRVPVIVISGSGHAAGDHALKAAESLGAARTFTKGFEHADLLEAVRELAGA